MNLTGYIRIIITTILLYFIYKQTNSWALIACLGLITITLELLVVVLFKELLRIVELISKLAKK